jgi:tetratricopeptide (TPR) repeat protein
LNALSADFYTLTGPPLQVQANLPPGFREDRRAVVDARESGDFVRALNLVRKIEPYLDPALAAYWRGSIWARAGETDIALAFFKRAEELAPQNGGYAYVWLDTLSRTNSGEALAIAEGLIHQPKDRPAELILKAAELVFSARRQMTDSEAVEVSRRLIPVFEDIVFRLGISGERLLLVSAIGLLGISNMEIGDFIAAQQWFDRGLQLFPHNPVLLTLRGIQFYESDPERSRQDFQQAILLDPRLVWPYYFLAHYYLVRNQFEECLQMAQRALPLASLDALRAECLEWIAVCQANLGFPPESVRAVFRAAHQLAPDNQRIGRNLQLFEGSLVGLFSPGVPWERPAPKSVQSLGQREFQPA